MQLRRTQRWPVRTVWIILIAGVLLVGGRLFVWPSIQRQSAVEVTIADLVGTPERYAGQLVAVRGYLDLFDRGISESPCEELSRSIVSDVSAGGRLRGPAIAIKSTISASMSERLPYVQLFGYFRWYQLQPRLDYSVPADFPCGQKWVLEVVDMRPAAPPTPLPATATWLAIEDALLPKSNISGFSIQGTIGYLVAQGELRAFDTSDPEHLRLLAVIPIPKAADWSFIENDRAIVIGMGSSGRVVQMIDLSDPTNAKPRGQYRLHDRIEWAALHGNMLYLLHFDKLQIVDVRDANQPIARGNYTFNERIRNIAVEGDRAYVSVNNGLLIFGVHNPDQPTLLGRHDIANLDRIISIQNQMVYVQVGGNVFMLDVRDLASPRMVQAEPPQKGDLRFQIVGGELQVQEQRQPATFVIRSRYRAGDMSYEHVQHAGDLLYLAGGYGLDILDIHDPGQPLLRARYRR